MLLRLLRDARLSLVNTLSCVVGLHVQDKFRTYEAWSADGMHVQVGRCKLCDKLFIVDVRAQERARRSGL